MYRNDSKRSGCSAGTPESLRYELAREIGAFEPLCYTGEEFAELVRSPNPFIQQALAEGVRV